MQLRWLAIPLFAAGVAAQPAAEEFSIKSGTRREAAAAAMRRHGFREGALALASDDQRFELVMWTVGEGTLVVRYSVKHGAVHDLQYLLLDERPKAQRKEFSLPVSEFVPGTGRMTVWLPKPAGTQPK